MKTRCASCGRKYDDVYRLTFCPHAWFQMHTVVSNGRESLLCTTVAQVRALLERWERESRRES